MRTALATAAILAVAALIDPFSQSGSGGTKREAGGQNATGETAISVPHASPLDTAIHRDSATAPTRPWSGRVASSSFAASSMVNRLQTVGNPERVEVYRTGFKYPHLRLERDPRGDVLSSMVADHLLVQLKAGVPPEFLSDQLPATGLALRRTVLPGSVYLVSLAGSPEPEAGTLEEIRDRLQPAAPLLAAVDPDYIVHHQRTPNDPDFSLLWGLHNPSTDRDIDAPEAWDLSSDASPVLVAVIDTGVDYLHEDLAANVWTNPGEIPGNGVDDDGNGFVDDVHGFDFVNNDGDPMDDHRHGTHCAGTIGARGNNGTGIPGVAWSVQLMAVKFLDDDGDGTTSDAIAAINYASANGADLTSNSWGGGGFSATLSAAITSSGVPFIAAAGNRSQNVDLQPYYPCGYPLDNIISVAATDRDDRLASFSSYGATSVDLAAPGASIYSTFPGDSYGMLSGTSMATPHVSGACALLMTRAPGLGLSQIKLHLLNSVDPVAELSGRVRSGGRLNLHRFLLGASEGAPVIDSDLEVTATLGEPFSYQISSDPAAAWYDAVSLPTSLSLDRTSGQISGTPNTAGIYDVALGAGNADGVGTATLRLTVVGPPPTITSPLAASATQGAPFIYQIETSPAADSYAATGLPTGLSVDGSSGVIVGTPLASGVFDVALSATNTGGTAEATLVLTVAAATPPEILSPLRASGVVSQSFSYQIKASNHPTDYGATGLPAGLSVDMASGAITGTPTLEGIHQVTISATNLGGTTQATLEIHINLPDAPVITSSPQAQGQVGQSFSYTIAATNSPDTYDAQGLPAGLSVDTASGEITGTPTEEGPFEVLLTASNLGGAGNLNLSLLILPPPPQITSPDTVSATAGQPVIYQITSDPPGTSYGADDLPADLSVDANTGEISGNLASAGEFVATVWATNTGGTGSAQVTFSVVPPPPVIGGALQYTFEAGETIDIAIVASNSPTSYASPDLPDGLSLDTATGGITGTLSLLRTYTFEVSASNAGGSGSAQMAIEIVEGPTRIISFSPVEVDPSGTVTITGVGFDGATGVYFAGRGRDLTPAESFTVLSDTEIQAVVPYLRMVHDSDRSKIVVISPKGLAVAFPPDTIEVAGGYDTGGGGGRNLVVREGGALIGGGGGHNVVVEGGGSARLDGGGGHHFYVASQGFLDVSEAGAEQIFHARDAFVLDETSVSADALPTHSIVEDVRVTIMTELLRVRQLPQISSPAEDAAVVGQSYLYRIETDGHHSLGELSFGTVGDLPPGLSFNTGTGFLSGYPTTAGVETVGLTVTNAEGTTTFTLTLTVTGDPVPVILGGSKLTGSSSDPFSYSMTVANGATGYGASGLPAGLSIDAGTGEISGTPAAGGVYPATLSATNAFGTTTRDFTFFIDESPLAITSFAPTSMASGTTLTVQGRGMGEVAGAYFVSRRNDGVASSAVASNSDSELLVTVPSLGHGWNDRTPVVLTSPSRSNVSFPATALQMVADGTIGSGYTVVGPGVNAVTGGGGGRKIYVESGGTISTAGGGGSHLIFLEDGATADMAGGGGGHLVFTSPSSTVLGATATVPVPPLGLSLVSQDLLNVFDLPVISSGDAAGDVGSPFTYQIEIEFPAPPGITYSATGLPPGLEVNTSGGLISGTPTASGEFNVELGATDNNGTGTKMVLFTIGDNPLPAWSGSYRLDVAAGEPISRQLFGTHSPTGFSASSLPDGLAISASGEISGQIDQPGFWKVPVEITNANGSTSHTLLVAVDRPQPLVFSAPPAMAVGGSLDLGGQNLEQVTETYFRSRSDLGLAGTIVDQSATSLSLTVPAINPIGHTPSTIVTLIGEGGATVVLPETVNQVTGTSPGGGGSKLWIRPGGQLASGGGGGMFVYGERGSYISIGGGGSHVIFAENGASVDLGGGGGGNIVVHAPNAVVLNPGNATLIPVDDLAASPVSGDLEVLPIPIITSPTSVRGYLDIPFFYTIESSNGADSYGATGLPGGLAFDENAGTISGDPTETGTFLVQLSATNGHGSATKTLELVVGDPYDHWRDTVFAALEGGSEAPLAGDYKDPDGDGSNNLFEFSRNSNPLVPDASPPDATYNGGQLRYSFRRRKGDGQGDTVSGYTVDGIRYLVETSSGLGLWNSGPDYLTEIGSPIDNGDGTETVAVAPLPAAIQHGRVLVRLRITREP